MKRIRALFVGTDLSLGYEKDKSYTIIVRKGAAPDSILINRTDGSGDCIYESIISFLDNWDLITDLEKV